MRNSPPAQAGVHLKWESCGLARTERDRLHSEDVLVDEPETD